MNSEAKTLQLLLEKRIEELERTIRRIPSRFAGGSAAPAPEQYTVVGVNVLPGMTALGIQRRTDTVLGSEMPVGTGGASGDTVIVAPIPNPIGFPNGVGVAKQFGTSTYIWVVLDTNSAYYDDMPAGKNLTGGGTLNLDKVVGSITYRYIVHTVVQAW